MSKLDEAREILEQIGMEAQQCNEISCLTLLALADVGPRTKWISATKKSKPGPLNWASVQNETH